MSPSDQTATAPPAERLTASVADPFTLLPSVAGRYALGPEIARGGMGVVYRATDTAFGREVAVKVLLDKYAPDSGTARRFADEARITGQLQHPGIPPAFDRGALADGRPFLAMKLVKGETLDTLLAAGPAGGADRGRLVAAFEQVCHAVGYAHAHGVVHRDLKPQNVMVGSFGEVQVMDWGLAKVLADARPAPADDPEATAGTGTEVKSLRDSEDLLTVAGSALGTPAYMPPEQAVGAVYEIDARSDVFGLGGILAAVLTGRPPFVGDTAETTRVMAARGQLDGCFARLDASGADPELVALCKRCLSPNREGRPADAGAVGRQVAALRQAADERARQAERDRLAAEVRESEQRRRRRAVLLYGSAVVAALTAGVAVTGLALVRAWRAETQAREAERTAKGETARAKQNLRTAGNAVRESLHRVASSGLAELPGAAPLRLELGQLAVSYNEQFLRDNPDDMNVAWDAHEIYQTMGWMYTNANQPDKAWEFYDKALAQGRRMAEHFREALGDRPFHLTPDGRQIIKITTADGVVDSRVDDDLAAQAHNRFERFAVCLTRVAEARRARGQFTEARPLLDEAEGPTLLGKLLAHSPEVRAYRRLEGVIHFERAMLDQDEGRPADALARFDRVTDLFRKLSDPALPPVPNGVVGGYIKGEGDTGRFGRAAAGRAEALLALGRAGEAEGPLAEALGRLEARLKAEPKADDRLAAAEVRLARGRVRAADPKRRAGALADFDAAAELLSAERSRNPHWVPTQRLLADVWRWRGRLLAAGGADDRGRAAADFKAARELCEAIAATVEGKPGVFELVTLTEALAGLAGLARDRGDDPAAMYAAAAARCREALAISPTHHAARTLLTAVEAAPR